LRQKEQKAFFLVVLPLLAPAFRRPAMTSLPEGIFDSLQVHDINTLRND
jgi:hypothetical protein